MGSSLAFVRRSRSLHSKSGGGAAGGCGGDDGGVHEPSFKKSENIGSVWDSDPFSKNSVRVLPSDVAITTKLAQWGSALQRSAAVCKSMLSLPSISAPSDIAGYPAGT